MRTRIDYCDFILLFGIFNVIASKELIWRFDSDISNPGNWVGGKLAEGCKGLHFAAVNGAPVLLKKLTTAEITLPFDGEIDLDKDGIIDLKDNNKCIKLKPIDYHDWNDPSSWKLIDNNIAIPDKERVPCEYDGIVIPKLEHARITENLYGVATVTSIKTDQNRTYYSFHNSFTVLKFRRTCRDPYGCLCHDEFIPCPMKEDHREGLEGLKCEKPITPEEFCDEICGAYLTYKPRQGPPIAEVQNKLKEYSSDTYVSKVKDYLGGEVVQVVFREKEYTGKSLDEADDFANFFKQDNAGDLQLYKSGALFREHGSGSLGIIFGTLAAVMVFFGVLLYMNGETPTTILTRFNTARGSVFTMPFFARFDNTDENLIIDGQSESGSILDIAKSFDNPMYGQSTPTESHHENPLYDVAKDEE